MALSLQPLGGIDDPVELIKRLRSILTDLEDQLNTRAQVYVSSNGKIPTGLNPNDVVIVTFQNQVALLVKQKTGLLSLTASHIGGLTANSTNFVGLKQSATLPSLVEFPNDNDWGFHLDTAFALMYLVYNRGGTLYKINIP